MKISIVVPCYNEINTIGTIIDRINNVFSKYDYEIILKEKTYLDTDIELCFHP